MLDKFTAYVKELANQDIYEDEHGFVWYQIVGDECYVKEIYIMPDKRKDGLSWKYLRAISTIAKERGCKTMLGSVQPSNSNAQGSLEFLLSLGFKLCGSAANIVYFKRDL